MQELGSESSRRMSTVRFIEGAIEWTLLLIMFGAPLAFGSVHTIIYRFIQCAVFLALFLFGVRSCLVESSVTTSAQSGFSFSKRQNDRFSSFVSSHPFIVPFLLWLGLVAMQLIPLGPELLNTISKETYSIHRTLFGFSQWRPLSLSAFDTMRALVQVVACAGLVYLVSVHRASIQETVIAHERGHFSSFGTGPAQDSFFNRLLFAGFLAVAFEVVYGLWEYLAGAQQIYFFPRSVDLESAAGTFVNRNHFANYLVLFFPILFSWAVCPAGGKQDRRFLSVHKILLAVVMLGGAIAVIASHSRMAIASGAAATLLLAFGFPFFGLRKRPIIFLAGFLAAAALFLFFLDPGRGAFQSRISMFLQGYETNRFRVWQDSIQIVKDFPWAGTGLGTYQLIFPKYSTVPITLRYSHAHSDWVELLVETGLIGFVLIVITVMWFTQTYLKALRTMEPRVRSLGIGIFVSLAAFSLHSIAEFNFHIPGNAYCFAILLGMALRLARPKTVNS